MKTKKRTGGIAARKIILPIIAVLFTLHTVIIVLIVQISATTSQLSRTMQNAGIYTQEASSLVSSVGLLSETTSSYVLKPEDESNVGSVNAYAKELHDNPDFGEALIERFDTYDVPKPAKDALKVAVENAEFMVETQLKAIALINSEYPLPDDDPRYAYIAHVKELLPALSQEEQDLDADGVKEEARKLIADSRYAMARRDVSENVGKCVGIIQGNSNSVAGEISDKVYFQRTTMWVCTITTIVIIAASAAVIYFQMIRPLIRMAKKIPIGEDLKEMQGLREIRTVSFAYNEMSRRRDALEGVMRAAAETDALTGVSNRHCYQQYMAELKESKGSVAVLLFDIDYLKTTNDTKGHKAGDRHIRLSAECIADCFGKDCFRIGGDEFAAI
ncbi:MAG: GGDEF domain-containing protein, partial [Clostridia bacterium]|nr:GGDEF domain-containing protein [Clostridia bacterium]